MPELPEPFACHVSRDGDTATLLLKGELDLDNADKAEVRLVELRKAGVRRVVLDLRELAFIDSTGLRLVLRWDAAARADAFDFRVIPGDGPVRRLFRLTGVEGRIAELEP